MHVHKSKVRRGDGEKLNKTENKYSLEAEEHRADVDDDKTKRDFTFYPREE
jgi:hypothetical protein